MNSTYEIRTMSADEVAGVALAMAAREGWNPGLHDAAAFYAADPEGFLAGSLDGEPIACISAVAYDDAFGFIGLYIVKPGYRGRGYGIRIWDAAMKYLGSRNIGLDGVVAQQDNYKKSGFVLAYRNIRFEGTSIRAEASFPEIIPFSDDRFSTVVHYDTALFPSPRPAFLREWLRQPGGRTFAALRNDSIAGYGTIRQCGTGYKIGPLFADNAEIAEQLFLALNNAVAPGTTIYLDTPEVNPQAVDLARKYNMTTVFETARMYTGPQPDIDMKKVFGVTTFELG